MRWVKTENGKLMPIDTSASATGNLWVVGHDQQGMAIVHVAKRDERPPDDGLLFKAHMATCTQRKPAASRTR
jgi:hypothetical protein